MQIMTKFLSELGLGQQIRTSRFEQFHNAHGLVPLLGVAILLGGLDRSLPRSFVVPYIPILGHIF